MSDHETIKATAESITEIAKTTQKTLETTEKLGEFMAKFISSPLDQISGIITDKLKYYRWENQLKLMENASTLLKQRGLDQPDKLIPLKIAVPLLESASMENEPSLQKLWAALLINFSSKNSNVDQNISFVELLKSISSLEAKILKEIYQLPFDPGNPIITKDLPQKAFNKGNERKIDETSFSLREDIEFALGNLERLGCLSMASTWGGGRSPNQVNQTLYGKKFVDSCS